LIGLEELCELLAGTGRLSLSSTGYVKYPGGKQSLGRTTRNQELVLVVDRGAHARARGPGVAGSAGDLLRNVRLARLLGRSFDPARVRAAFAVEGNAIVVELYRGKSVRLPMRHLWRFTADALPPRFGDSADAARFVAALDGCAVGNVREEIDVIVGILRTRPDARERGTLLKEVLRLVNKLAHRKYSALFWETLDGLRVIASGDPALGGFIAGLDRIALTAEKRRVIETR
jgi:hypothetical protein